MMEELYTRPTPVRRTVAAEDLALPILGAAGFAHLAFTLPVSVAPAAVLALGLLGGAAAARYRGEARRWS